MWLTNWSWRKKPSKTVGRCAKVERRSQLAHQKAKPEAAKTISPDIRRINDALTEHLGVNAEVKTSNQKKGKIVLHFDTPETFEYLLKQLGINQEF